MHNADKNWHFLRKKQWCDQTLTNLLPKLTDKPVANGYEVHGVVGVLSGRTTTVKNKMQQKGNHLSTDLGCLNASLCGREAMTSVEQRGWEAEAWCWMHDGSIDDVDFGAQITRVAA